MRDNNLEIPLYAALGSAVMLVLFSLGIVLIQSLKIKKIDTYKLLIGE